MARVRELNTLTGDVRDLLSWLQDIGRLIKSLELAKDVLAAGACLGPSARHTHALQMR